MTFKPNDKIKFSWKLGMNSDRTPSARAVMGRATGIFLSYTGKRSAKVLLTKDGKDSEVTVNVSKLTKAEE